MQPSDSKEFLIKTLILVWAILCILLFVLLPGKVTYVQWANLAEWQLFGGKLARLDPARDLTNLLAAFIGVAVFSLACTSLGVFVAKITKIDSPPNSAMPVRGLSLLASEFIFGYGLFSLIFLSLGGIYKLSPLYVVMILTTGFLLGLRYIGSNLHYAFMAVKSALRATLEQSRDKTILWLSVCTLLFSLLYSTARISYDASAIYFSNAKITSLTHNIQFFMDDTFVASVFQTVIQSAALIQLFGDQAARLLSWVFGVVMLIFSVALGDRVGLTKRAKLILVALLLTSTAFLDLTGDGKVDLISSALAIAALYWIVVESQNQESSKSLFLLSGFLSGLAIVARPFNAFLLGVFASLFYLQRMFVKDGFEHIGYKRFVNSMFWVGLGVLALGIYHLLANWIILGSPLAFLSSISGINPSAGPWDFDPNQILAIRLLYPFVATFYNSPQTLGNISPLFLAFLPALLLPEVRKNIKLSKEMWVLLGISIITLLLWISLFFTVYEIRYVLFLWAIIFMPVAEIIASVLESKDRLLQHISSALIILLLIFGIVRTIYISLDTYSPIDKQGNPQCFCESLSPINKAAARGDRVLTLSAFRYYLRTDLFACSTKHDEYKKLRTAAQSGNEAFWLEVYRQGYKFISYEQEYTTKHLQMEIVPSPSHTPEWLQLEQLYSTPDHTHAAYRITIKNPPESSVASCSMNSSGIWEVLSTK